MNKWFCIYIVCLAGCLSLSVTAQAEQQKLFNLPKYNKGAPAVSHFVDNCLMFGHQCGAPAANRFCEQSGYDRATQFRRGAPGAHLPTVVVGDGRSCNAPGCVALTSITCSRTSTREFLFPRYANKYLDYCLTWGRQCGRPAADKFCRDRNYGHAKAYRVSASGQFIPTYVPQSNQTCNAPNCHAFKSITCTVGVRPPVQRTPIPWDRIRALQQQRAGDSARYTQCKKRCYDRHVGALGRYPFWRRERRANCI